MRAWWQFFESLLDRLNENGAVAGLSAACKTLTPQPGSRLQPQMVVGNRQLTANTRPYAAKSVFWVNCESQIIMLINYCWTTALNCNNSMKSNPFVLLVSIAEWWTFLIVELPISLNIQQILVDAYVQLRRTPVSPDGCRYQHFEWKKKL